ncbi:DegT/DnrJ/EryC1/StrS family aminotransferase [Candidatus Woesearchaeota archaeon]|nr:DegT/DnrJ/EryC1/StrS family aminotransferase [Candidatus Woesearchaeota archaeon]
MDNKPAILNGRAVFDKRLPIIRPNVDKYVEKELLKDISAVLNSNMLTSVDIKLKKFEEELENYIGVKHVIGVSSCTSGLILSMQALGLRNSEVLVPAFTFSATVHAAYWNNCKIRFVDIDRETFTISPEEVEKNISPETKAIIAVHMYGNPCYIERLQEIASKHNLKLIFDCAHALGSSYQGKKIGQFGDVEVFSASPTKLLTTIEGGIVATNNTELAEMLKIDRNYGNYPDYSCKRPGLNARMSEINAVTGLHQLKDLDKYVENRNSYVDKFKKELKNIQGINFQIIKEGNVSTHKDFGFTVNENEFGLNRYELARALNAENIMTKFYFYPPMHKLDAYKEKAEYNDLKNTELVSNNVICLPIYNFMDEETINKICKAIIRIHKFKTEVKEACK